MKSTALLIISAAISVSSQAAVVIDNLATGSQSFSLSLSGPTATGFLGGPFVNREVAFSFNTGNYDTTLDRLDFIMAIGNPNLSPIQLSLSTGTSVPGGNNSVLIGTATPGSTSPTVQQLSVTPTAPIPLLASTLYWVHFTVPSGSAIYSIANTDTPVVEPGWSLGNSWSKTPFSAWSELDSGPVARIRLTVPEPSSLMLAVPGFLLLARRKRTPSSSMPAR